jgi:hypothetical protein
LTGIADVLLRGSCLGLQQAVDPQHSTSVACFALISVSPLGVFQGITVVCEMHAHHMQQVVIDGAVTQLPLV